MPHPRSRSADVPDLRRGRQPGEADQGPPCQKRRFPRSRRGPPVCLGIALANPPGPLPRFADRSDSCYEAACRFASWLSTAQNPSRHVRPDLWGTSGHGTPSGGSLTCPECSSACGWDGVARLSRPSQPGTAGGVHDTRHGGRDTPDARGGRGQTGDCAGCRHSYGVVLT
jgi:hypothetical protein